MDRVDLTGSADPPRPLVLVPPVVRHDELERQCSTLVDELVREHGEAAREELRALVLKVTAWVGSDTLAVDKSRWVIESVVRRLLTTEKPTPRIGPALVR